MDEFTRYLTDVSTKVDTYQQPREPVEGGAVSERALLLLLRLWLRRVQGAALPKNTHKKNSRPRPAVSV
ncbi:TPA: hypothetical protein UMV35_001346 [Stenotrophomonas maltophilia]|uniref:hypothetical protein n=2 Tax=Stenotrophomonas TaxID=40323 RepID=UPI0013DD4E62|nr:hypothetical protein [Stenotrophomonas maltophilia]MBH1594294.1 hypothetical protein [Stenotrophomonas maltophilia]HEL3749072.1 hypothetical protein [Stenotrophomonas maltophilia]HEL7729937.1 hypothetical protein [Stenotrophomonas maltophilia]